MPRPPRSHLEIPTVEDAERRTELAREDAARRARRDRENLSAHRFLIAAPHDLGTGPLVMPANGRLAISHSAGLLVGEVTISVGDRLEFSHTALDADEVWRGILAEEGMAISQTGAPTGTLSLFLVNPLDGTYELIATQVVA